MNSASDRQDQAARTIQRAWRRRGLGAFLTPSVRLNDVKLNAGLATARRTAELNDNSPRARWRRAIRYAARLNDANAALSEHGLQSDPEADGPTKIMEVQHWLELVDGKHRYGSNLKVGVAFLCSRIVGPNAACSGITESGGSRTLRRISFIGWIKAKVNLYRWRNAAEKIWRERHILPRMNELFLTGSEANSIRYFSTEQRLNYLVEIDATGRLCWARNHELVDTTPGHWKDTNGEGIVPDTDGSIREALSRRNSSDSRLDTAATHYAGVRGKYKLTREFRKRFTLHGIVNRLLRKTVRKNTWIYCSDKHFNIFVGIKDTGRVQHSSLLGGGVVTSAGLITVKFGVIHTLSPLSGHYRTSVEHFHTFVDVLRSRGVDMSKAKISKAEIALWGIEHIKKAQKSKQHAVESGKETLAQVVSKVADAPVSWKRDILEGRKQDV
ncbi:hypothetical protein MKEN_00791800 [Mycena kentingensis (nom. inval.)]|nr:hypothetical protein MKEN_00791800 [Mycena kentingensis (nom. inval.)]